MTEPTCPTCAATCADVQRLRDELEYTRYWYGCRLERLNQMAREEFSEEMCQRHFNIMANGTAEPHEPPTYAQQYNSMKHRAERAEAENEKLRAQLAAVRTKLEQVVCVTEPDAGLIWLSNESPMHETIIDGKRYQTYSMDYFSPLGAALIEAWELTKEQP